MTDVTPWQISHTISHIAILSCIHIFLWGVTTIYLIYKQFVYIILINANLMIYLCELDVGNNELDVRDQL